MNGRCEKIRVLMQTVRFCCYSPSRFNPLDGEKILATEACIQSDITLLREIALGLITYGLGDGLERIPGVAARFSPPSPVIPGIWDITDETEIAQAIELAHRLPETVIAICCGNEGLYFGRYSTETLRATLGRLRSELPESCLLTSSEPLVDPQTYPLLANFALDFHFPTIHPWFLPQRAMGAASADWVVEQIEALAALSELFTCCKETGWPSGGDAEATPECQKAFWQRLLCSSSRSPNCAYALFEAFDAGTWKIVTNAAPVETHWGLYDARCRPKPVVEMLLSQYRVAPALPTSS